MDALVPDDLWAVIEPLLPFEPEKPKGGRPRTSDRAALAGIILVLRTGMQWKLSAGVEYWFFRTSCGEVCRPA